MGVITISLPDKEEQIFRNLAISWHGRSKGAMSKTLSRLMHSVLEEEKLELAWKKIAKIMDEKGIGLGGKKPYESRNELYDR